MYTLHAVPRGVSNTFGSCILHLTYYIQISCATSTTYHQLPPNNNDTTDLDPLFMKDDNPQLHKFRSLFSTPFNCVFSRVVDIDQAGGMNIFYIAPDKITRLESREAMERFLDWNPTLDIPTLNFCLANLNLGFKDPAWETVCVQDPRQRHS